MNVIYSNLRRALTSSSFWLAVAVTSCLLIAAVWEDGAKQLSSVGFFTGEFIRPLLLDNIRVDLVMLSLPILSTLPYSGNYLEEWSGGYIKFCLHRTTRSSYLAGKIIACVCSGGLCLVLGLLLPWGLTVLFPAGNENWISSFYLLPTLKTCLRLLFYGSFWSLTGMLLSVCTETTYFAVGGPFVLYYVLMILYQRYLDGYFCLSPREWLFPGEHWPLYGWSTLLLMLGLNLCVVFLLIYCVQRRLREL